MSINKYQDLRTRIVGPVYPICPAFNKDGSIDHSSTAQYVEYLNSFNVRTIISTIGTSRFNLLTDSEVKAFNKTIVDANQGKAVTIVANPTAGDTKHTIEFTQHAEKIGADGILLYYSDRYYNEDRLYHHLKKVSDSADIAMMLHANPIRKASGGMAHYSIELCSKLADFGNFIGMKEENGDHGLRYKLAVNLKDKMNLIVAQAGMRSFLECCLFGTDAYLVGVGSFLPQIEEDFYTAVVSREFDKALNLVRTYEEPFFNVAMPMGWHVAMKGTMSLMGLMPITERSPLFPADEHELQQLQSVITNFGWI